ncbi:MAG: alpha/beta hydrolase domain-containing protein, partial [Bryobacteraceae bacterium]
QLTVRDRCDAQRRVIPRGQWQFARLENGKPAPDPTSVYMAAGFEPGKVYEVVYTTKDPAMVGLGPTAIRDLISFLKYGTPNGGITLLGDQRAFLKRAIGFGTSQSGRFLRTFLYYGFNRDERNRRVFDGVWAHVAGAGRGSFNHRFAQPSRDGHPHMNCQYPTDIYPFSDLPQKDTVTGLDEGILSKAQTDNVAPRIFYTNSSYEYWGRSASLVHTSLDGRQDIGPSADTRVYLFAGSQHGPGGFPPQQANGQNLNNANDYRWPMRALLAAMNDWLTTGKEPPASQYPLVAKDHLIAPAALAFPKIPQVNLPLRQQKAYRADYGPDFRTLGVVTKEPPALGAAFPTLVPQVNTDGNETSGIVLPVVSAPLATYTGWNLRHPNLGATEELFSMVGSTIPFARTAAERKKSGDPRLSIEERYKSRDEYLSKFETAARDLVRRGYLLEADVSKIVARGAAQWDAWATPK